MGNGARHLGRSAPHRTALAAQGGAELVRAALANHAYVSGVQEKASAAVASLGRHAASAGELVRTASVRDA